LQLLAAIGGVLAVSGNDILLLALGIELYALSRLFTGVAPDLRARENVIRIAGMSLLLFGMAALWASVGTTDLGAIGDYLAQRPGPQAALFYLGAAFALLGIGFSLRLLPPYGRPGGAQDMVSPLVGTGALLRLAMNGLGTLYAEWMVAFWAAGVLAVIWGWLASRRAIDTGRGRALEISQRGFLLLALAYAPLQRGVTALVIGTMAYILGQGIVFACEAVARLDGQVPSFAGLARRNLWVGSACLVAFLSLAGGPATLGFIGRSEVLWAAQDQRQIWAVLLGLLLYVLVAADYLQLILITARPNPDATRLRCHEAVCIALGLAAVALVILGLFPEPLQLWAQRMTLG
jgi:NADH-quinone oxidoreductase subunit N